MLASKTPYASNFGSSQHAPVRNVSEESQRTQVSAMPAQDGMFTSPTNSEFSDVYDGLDSIRAWDEKKVGEWLHTIRCGQYESLFKSNNFTGESLLECDQKILAEIGIKKIGDRVRINVAIKQLRNKSSLLRNKRNRDSLAILEGFAGTPPLQTPLGRWAPGRRMEVLNAIPDNSTRQSCRISIPLGPGSKSVHARAHHWLIYTVQGSDHTNMSRAQWTPQGVPKLQVILVNLDLPAPHQAGDLRHHSLPIKQLELLIFDRTRALMV